MIGTIAKKEFLENILSRKFLVASILAVFILSVGVYSMASQYEQNRSWYQTQIEEYKQENTTTYVDIATREVYRALGRPEPMKSMVGVQGYDVMSEGGMGGSIIQQALGQETESPVWSRFGMLDLAFMVGFLMSLVAVIFSYDSISGEKERGTLKLTLTNDVPKDNVLLGKYIGGTASVLLPFVAAIVLALGITALAFGIPFSMADYQAIVVLVVLGCAVISAFYLLGMFISSLTERSVTTMIVVLLAWILLTQGIGAAAALTATQTTDTMTYEEYRDQYMEIAREAMEGFDPNENMQARMEEMQRRMKALKEAYQRSQEEQLNMALTLARISPSEAYKNITGALAGQSWEEQVETNEQVSEYVNSLQQEYQEEMRNTTPGGGGMTEQPSRETFEPDTELQQYYNPWSLTKQLGVVTYDIAAIILINILLFIGAYVAFLRYDVR